jgi:hypothetical protein
VNRAGDNPFHLRRLAVKSGTDTSTIERWLRFFLMPEQLRSNAVETVRRFLGPEEYALMRRRFFGTRPSEDVLVIDR